MNSQETLSATNLATLQKKGPPAALPRLESPRRLPAHQILDDQNSLTSKRNSDNLIGEGLASYPPEASLEKKSAKKSSHKRLDHVGTDKRQPALPVPLTKPDVRKAYPSDQKLSSQ